MVLLRNSVSQMVYKHAISTVVPAHNVRLPSLDQRGGEQRGGEQRGGAGGHRRSAKNEDDRRSAKNEDD